MYLDFRFLNFKKDDDMEFQYTPIRLFNFFERQNS